MKKILLYIASILIVIGVGTFVYSKTNPPQVTIPQELTKQNAEKKLTEYMPGWLPGTYVIDKDSFSREEGQVFTFSATDEDRNRLFFSEQPIPKDFDFNNFYSTKVIDPKKLENTPFETIYAKSLYGKTWILSMRNDTTWIMMTTDTPVGEVLAQKIAQEMKPY
ncbi:MAG TPA: hypothetical protein VLF20_00100 [Patescibacteria group bacterium]|nr:hypothetical protein [Patescibacteria group bacterium]